MKKILFILFIGLSTICQAQIYAPNGLVSEDSLRVEGFTRLIDSLISERFARFLDGFYLGDSAAGSNITKLDSFTLSLTDTAFWSWGRHIPLAGSAGDFSGWGKTIIVATFGGDFNTIQAAINAANAWDVIIVHPDTYDEQITIDKSLGIKLQPGAVINYTGANNNYTLNINSGITVYIEGGIIRHTAASYGRVIKNAGILHTTSDIENSTSSTTYMIDNFADAELYVRNDFTGNINYSVNNRVYLDGKVDIDTKTMSFHYYIDSAADIIFNANKFIMDSTHQHISYVQNESKLQAHFDEVRLRLYDGIEVEMGPGLNIRDSSTFTYSGNYPFAIGSGTHTKITLNNIYCNEGIPRVGINNDADSGNCFVTITNFNLKWIYPDRMPDKDGFGPTPVGTHYFENASDTAYCIFRLSNGYIQWSHRHELGDTSRELGNIFYFNGGEMYMNNVTIVDYNDDYEGYGNITSFVSSKRTRIYNCNFDYYGHQTGPMFSMLDRSEGSSIWDIEFKNCNFSRRECDTTFSFFDWSWQYRHINDSDHVVFQNCTFEDDSTDNITIFSFSNGGAGYMQYEDFLSYLEGNIKTDQYIIKQRAGDIRMLGPGHFSTTREYFGYRVKMNDWASCQGLSVDDTVDLVVTWKEEIGAAENGEIPRRNWMDLEMGLMIRDSNLTAAPYYFRYYDIRATSVQPGDGLEVMVDTNVFDSQAGLSLHPAITWFTNQTGDNKYFMFRIINRDPTYAITLDAWMKQSLDIESIEFIEPYEE